MPTFTETGDTNMMHKTLAALVAAAAALTLTACGNNDETADFNQQDVTFAQQMIPHHEQAMEMAELADTRAQSPAVERLAADIKEAQGPEIETMTGWLREWGEDVPSDSDMEHGNGHGDMAGMMSDDAMDELEAANGAEFDRLFLTAMIDHHEGAIEMAKAEQEGGQNSAAIDMAEDIETAQASEIKEMKALLGS
jgi:uncharacterized protein (DUF305 family)